MTRKDYFLIAKAIKETMTKEQKRAFLRKLIPALKADNPSFQTFRFLLSCDAPDDMTKEFV